MSATNFNTRNDTFRKLLGNGLVYRVPRFQRDYSWSQEEWEDLWHDILGTIAENGEPAHYMGYLVLQSSDDKSFDVIDGQQRLTTLSIIVLAALRNLKRLERDGKDPERTRQRLDGLRQTYIGYLDPVTLVPRSKLTLNRNNDHYYQTYLVPLVDQLPQRGFKASEHALRKAFEWYDRQIREWIRGASDPGMQVAQLIDRMSDKLFFTVITVTDELNAYKVFETLNARGVRLSATDLLKNYLFSVLHREGQHDHELKALDDRWESIVGRLGAESFPDFLRAHWLSRKSFVRQSDLFKTIRSSIVGRKDVFDLLSGLDEDMDTYLALTDPDNSRWEPDAREAASRLKMFAVRQPYPLLMAARRCLGTSDFGSLIRALVVLSFRYNVIGNLQTSEQERAYFNAAQRVTRSSGADLAGMWDELRIVYPNDEAFQAAFAEKSITTTQSRNRRIVRYILCEIERQMSGAHHDFASDTISLEHVCPKNPDDGWATFSDRDIDEMTDRLGNLTLLQAGQNGDLGSADYETKRAVYARSAYVMTQRLAAENETWSASRIAARQRALAHTATGLWRIAQLS